MTAGANILVVDDDPDMRETLEMILEAAGYSVTTARDGEECLIALKKRKPDLLLRRRPCPGSPYQRDGGCAR